MRQKLHKLISRSIVFRASWDSHLVVEGTWPLHDLLILLNIYFLDLFCLQDHLKPIPSRRSTHSGANSASFLFNIMYLRRCAETHAANDFVTTLYAGTKAYLSRQSTYIIRHFASVPVQCTIRYGVRRSTELGIFPHQLGSIHTASW